MQCGKLRAVPVSVAGEREASNSLPLSQAFHWATVSLQSRKVVL